MSAKEFKDLDSKQLQEREAELRKELFGLKTQAATEKVKDTSEFKKIKKDIARIKTLQGPLPSRHAAKKQPVTSK